MCRLAYDVPLLHVSPINAFLGGSKWQSDDSTGKKLRPSRYCCMLGYGCHCDYLLAHKHGKYHATPAKAELRHMMRQMDTLQERDSADAQSRAKPT